MSERERERLSSSLVVSGIELRALADSIEEAMNIGDSALLARLLESVENAADAAIVKLMLLKVNMTTDSAIE